MPKIRLIFSMPKIRLIFTSFAVLALGTTGLALSAAHAASPDAPASGTATYTEGGILVRWTKPDRNGGERVIKYHIRERGHAKPVLSVDGSERSVLWTSVPRSAGPRFAIRALNADGWSSPFVTSAATQPATEPTDPPTDEPTEPPTGPDPDPVPGDLPYTSDSFFKSRVDGAGVPVSAARTTAFHSFMASHPDQAATDWPKININPYWAMSYHVGRETDPIWTLTGGNTSHAKLQVLTTQGFHMDDAVADTFPIGTQDRPGVMIDPVFGYTVQFANAVVNKANRTISVSNAAVFYHSSNGLDYRNPGSNDSRNFSSRGRIPDAMVVRRDSLDRAVAAGTGLGHVLHLFLVETNTADGGVHPMVGTESAKTGFGAQGERIRIKPSVNLVTRGLSGAALALARTLQQNGAYLGDNSGSTTQIKASQPHHYVGTNITTDAFKGKISWNDFEVVEQGWQ